MVAGGQDYGATSGKTATDTAGIYSYNEYCVIYEEWRDDFEHWCTNYDCHVQEMSNTREVDDLKRQLQSSEALVADLQKTLQQRDSELAILRSKVSQYSF